MFKARDAAGNDAEHVPAQVELLQGLAVDEQRLWQDGDGVVGQIQMCQAIATFQLPDGFNLRNFLTNKLQDLFLIHD